MEETLSFLNNGLTVSIDWIAFTVMKLNTVQDVVNFLGYETCNFTQMPKGGMGYKSMIKLDGYPVTILYDGKEDMGIHVSISGTAIPEVIKTYKKTLACDTPFGLGYEISLDSTVLIEFLSAIRKLGNLSRIDLAIDDMGCKYFTMDDVESALMEHRILSKFRNWRNLCERTLSGEKSGHTIYLGSRTSDIFLRVYDKMLERTKQADGEISMTSFSWVRWELELKNERACQVADMLIDKKELGRVCVGILNNYMRIINLDDNNRSRCSIDSKWIEFIDTMERLRLYVRDEPKTLEDKLRWFNSQVAPTLTGLLIANGGTLDFFTDNIDYYSSRMSKEMMDLVSRANPDWNI